LNVRTGEFARERARDRGRDKAAEPNRGPSRAASRGRTRVWGRVVFEFQRSGRAVWGFAVVAGFGVLLAKGWFHDLASARGDAVKAAAAACLIAVLVAKIAGRLRMTERRRTPLRERLSDIELGLLLLTATYVFLAALGGVTSPVFPLVYTLVSFLVTFHRLSVGLPLAAAAIGLETIMAFGPGSAPGAPDVFAGHVVFIVVFAVLNVAFLHAEVARQRREHRRRLDTEVATMREEAQDFRLISTALPSDSRVRTRAEEEEKLSQGSIETIHQQLFATLDIVRKSLGLQTCALLWLDATSEKLKLKEVASDGPALAEGPFPARTGVFGAILKERKPLFLEAPRPQLLPYYEEPVEIDAFVGVPVVEGRALRGILVADRREGAMLAPGEVDLIVSAAAQVMRIVQSERVFQAVERSKHEHERFYKASVALNRALTLAEVYEAAIEGARGVCDFDFAAIATCDPRDGSHTLHRVVGDGAAALDGKRFRDPASLASMVVKNKLALPAAGEWSDRDDLAVFDPSVRFRDFRSLLVLPLPVKDDVLGTFTVAAHRPGAFPTDRREMLGVIANQVAISLQNGRMVEALEEKATTDGLTGLVNHRTFQERFSAMLARAERQDQSVALLLTDIDHFKKINDNYGHPTGDDVLRRVAALLKTCARKVDVTARYGGEEFALVLEATDRDGARDLAERIRQEVSELVFESGKGPFGATLSLGIAVYPHDGKQKAELIKNADLALYGAKHGGRNRAVAFGDLDSRAAKAKAAG
jgi:two-component system cell cycle response regulator